MSLPAPLADDRVPFLRTHAWLGLDDDSRCADCLAVLADCDSPCVDEEGS